MHAQNNESSSTVGPSQHGNTKPFIHQISTDDRDDNTDETLVKEVLRVARDDISSSPQIHLVKDEIEKIHFEDTYQTHRLNKDVDINDINIHHLMQILNHNEQHYVPITKATIRTMQQQTVNIRMQLDSGANRTVTPHRHLLHNIHTIPTLYIDGVGGTV